jgi:hypothetical protein
LEIQSNIILHDSLLHEALLLATIFQVDIISIVQIDVTFSNILDVKLDSLQS